jgi:hypothetical protein
MAIRKHDEQVALVWWLENEMKPTQRERRPGFIRGESTLKVMMKASYRGLASKHTLHGISTSFLNGRAFSDPHDCKCYEQTPSRGKSRVKWSLTSR